MRKIDKIILHCSASDRRDQTAAMIHDWHKARGWKGIGYHYFIRPNGLIEGGRYVEEIGAHCKGENATSIGICLAGNMRFREVQFKSLEALLSTLQSIWPNLTIHGHNEFDINKLCPVYKTRRFKDFYKNGGSSKCSNILKQLMKLLKRFLSS